LHDVDATRPHRDEYVCVNGVFTTRNHSQLLLWALSILCQIELVASSDYYTWCRYSTLSYPHTSLPPVQLATITAVSINHANHIKLHNFKQLLHSIHPPLSTCPPPPLQLLKHGQIAAKANQGQQPDSSGFALLLLIATSSPRCLSLQRLCLPNQDITALRWLLNNRHKATSSSSSPASK
jgi:hypothetical protein